MKKLLAFVFFCAVVGSAISSPAELTAQAKKELREAYQLILTKEKGPFTLNYCTCVNGKLAPVADKNMRVRPNPCAEVEGVGQLFCSAYRNDLADILAKHGLYVANIFSNEVYLWDATKDHHRITKGFILEKYYIENYPKSKIASSRAYTGISGAEFEVKYAPIYFAKYYSLPDWSDFQDYLLQYELQRRYFFREDLGSISAIRDLSSAIYRDNPDFKPVKDLIHNQISPGLVQLLENYMAENSRDVKSDPRYAQLVAALRKLTRIDRDDLKGYLPKITNTEVRRRLDAVLQTSAKSQSVELDKLSNLLTASRRAVASRKIAPEEAIELVNLNVSANLLLHLKANELISQKKTWPVKDLLQMAKDLLGGIYGAGLISNRELTSACSTVDALLARNRITVGELHTDLNRLNRVAEWAQASIRAAFYDVWEPWVFLFPEVKSISDDIIRSSPLLDYAGVVRSLQDSVLSEMKLEHEVLGKTYSAGLRALNPGLAVGRLVFFSPRGNYSRKDILALETTNAELEPVAGIITKDEGNAVSHMQLLARALGVPNAVFHEEVYKRLEAVKGKELFYAITPKGRIILKEAAKMDRTDKLILAEYQMNVKRTADGDARAHNTKFEINAKRLDLGNSNVVPLDEVRRKDSGVFCGPKAAFLGELKHFFPNNVAPGVVVPFGIYYRHFKKAKVALPEELKFSGIAEEGASLSKFTARTYDTFFNRLLKDQHLSSNDLAEWIKPRLAIIRYSLGNVSLDPRFVSSLKDQMNSQGLFLDNQGERLRGVFVRSDTNVEDLPDFNGAGLNLTIFNLMTFNDVLDGIKKVWASPFTYRSFSWRQSVINDPNLVFPSIIVMEAIPSEKSGVLITADVESGDPGFMTIATSEGVGGTVDGSPAETILYKPGESVLLSQYKSPTRRVLIKGGRGGVRFVPSTASESVLTGRELSKIVYAADKIKATFVPEKGADGQPLPWDIEFGFVSGKLYLFQTRPFVGNSDLANLPALLALDQDLVKKENQPFNLQQRVVLR